MMHLLMSETTESNLLEKKLFESIGGVPSTIAYIPSKTDLHYCDFDQEFHQKNWDILLESDVDSKIHVIGRACIFSCRYFSSTAPSPAPRPMSMRQKMPSKG
jgi:hypothetical protein